MTIKCQNLTRLHESIKQELLNAFDQALSTSAFIQGTPVREFEAQFQNFVETPYCLGVANGTDALELTLEALGIHKGDQVIVPAMTFAATAESVVRAGASPVFADVEAGTLCMSLKNIKAAFDRSKSNVRALIFVHLYGRAVDLTDIRTWCDREKIYLIEDCAQAHGARVAGKHVGTFGHAGTFSFYPGKNLGALGDAGAIVTSEKDLYETVKLLRDHGRSEKYTHLRVGRNSRLDALQAAFLSIKLKHLNTWNQARRNLASIYETGLSGMKDLVLLDSATSSEAHVFHQFVIRTSRRDSLQAHLARDGIESAIHYPIPLHEQPAFTQWSTGAGQLQIASEAGKDILSLPIDPLQTAAETLSVCNSIRRFFTEESE